MSDKSRLFCGIVHSAQVQVLELRTEFRMKAEKPEYLTPEFIIRRATERCRSIDQVRRNIATADYRRQITVRFIHSRVSFSVKYCMATPFGSSKSGISSWITSVRTKPRSK